MTTFKLEGLERFFACCPDCTCNIAHVMTVKGNIDALLHDPAHAFMRAFQRHPRMRAKLDRNDPLTAVVCPTTEITKELIEKEYLDVLTLEDGMDWLQYCIDRYDTPFDMHGKFAFHLSLLRESQESLVLVLRSNHMLSDGCSGLVILNEFIQQSIAKTDGPVQDLLLTPSIYSQIKPQGAIKWISNCLYPLLKPVLLAISASMKPLISDHPELQGRSYGHVLPKGFAAKERLLLVKNGTPENLQNSLAACKKASVTLHGVAIVAFAIAIAVAKFGKADAKIKMTLDVDYNMRKRVKDPFKDDHVGFNVGIGTLDYIETSGIKVTSSFWEEARKAKKETEKFQTFMHSFILKFIHKELRPSASEKIMQSVAEIRSDGNLSNIGRYPFQSEFPEQGFSIDNIHVWNNINYSGPMCILFLTTVKSIGFSFTSTMHPEHSQKIFDIATMIIENAGNILPDETIAAVIEKYL